MHYSYGFDVFIVHFAFAILLFFIINWIGKHSYSLGYIQLSVALKADEAPAFNFLLRVLTPIVFIIICSTILYGLSLDRYVQNIYLVSIYYFMFRALFNVMLGRFLLMNWKQQLNLFAWTSFLSYISYIQIIVIKKNVLPDFGSISNELWLIIIFFLYTIFNRMQFPSTSTERRKNNYITSRYKYLSKKYGKIIAGKIENKKLESLVYAILVYESFNRPKPYRMFEPLLFLFKKPRTLGVMQVKTDKYINDQESVRLGVAKIYDFYNNLLNKENTSKELSSYGSVIVSNVEDHLEKQIILNYNPDIDYYGEIYSILKVIRYKFYNNCSDKLYIQVNR